MTPPGGLRIAREFDGLSLVMPVPDDGLPVFELEAKDALEGLAAARHARAKLLDRETDFVTAMLVSLETVARNKAVMGTWAVIVAVSLFVAMLPVFLGLFVALPVLGHATWHLYRRALYHPAT